MIGKIRMKSAAMAENRVSLAPPAPAHARHCGTPAIDPNDRTCISPCRTRPVVRVRVLEVDRHGYDVGVEAVRRWSGPEGSRARIHGVRLIGPGSASADGSAESRITVAPKLGTRRIGGQRIGERG